MMTGYLLFKNYWKSIFVALFISLLCFIPSSEINKIPIKITFGDLIVHFVMFFVFSAALYYDMIKYRKNQNLSKSPIWNALTISFLFAVSTEVVQFAFTVLNRTGSFSDLLADVVGSSVFLAIAKIIKRKSAPVF